MLSIGIYAYRAEVRALLDRYLAEGYSPDKTRHFAAWLHQQVPVYGHRIRGDEGLWFDIGSHEQYDEANRILTQLQSDPAGSPTRTAGDSLTPANPVPRDPLR